MGSAYRVELSFDDVEAYDPDNCLTSGARWRRGMAVRVVAGPFRFLTGASNPQMKKASARSCGSPACSPKSAWSSITAISRVRRG